MAKLCQKLKWLVFFLGQGVDIVLAPNGIVAVYRYKC